MSAQPTVPSAPHLEALPSLPPAVADPSLLVELETERSAGKAMIAAVKELDSRLAEQHRVNAELEARCLAAEVQIVEYASKLTMQVSDNQRMRRESRAADRWMAKAQATEASADLPAWRRLLRR